MMAEKKSETINPVWARFCTVQIDDWLDWITSIHVNSYLEMAERFIALNPFYVPDTEEDIFDQLMINEDFLSSLSDTGFHGHNLVKELRFYGRLHFLFGSNIFIF